MCGYQESLHPNAFGQLAERRCMRLAHNNGDPRGGACVRAGNGLVPSPGIDEPNMALR